MASVYAAIVLEGVSNDRGRRAEAIVALSALKAELELDYADASEVQENQAEHASLYDRLLDWLETPSMIPARFVRRDVNASQCKQPHDVPAKVFLDDDGLRRAAGLSE